MGHAWWNENHIGRRRKQGVVKVYKLQEEFRRRGRMMRRFRRRGPKGEEWPRRRRSS
jgi:hypothetical protein